MRTRLTQLSILTLSIIIIYSCGSSMDRFAKSADISYQQANYNDALSSYEKILLTEGRSIEALYKAAFSAQQMLRFQLADKYYSLIDDNSKRGVYADTDFQMGMVHKGMANYSMAISYFRTYMRGRKNADGELYLEAQIQIEYCEWAIHQVREASPMNIVNLGTHVNSERDELAPLLYADKLYFTSQVGASISKTDGTRIHSAIQKQDNRIDKANPNNSEFQISNISLTADARRMYFTICKTDSGIFGNSCEIYYRDKSYEGEWERHKKLPANINLKGYNATQPSIGFDKTLRKEVLFFVSDRPGGTGKYDIWATVLEGKEEFGNPFPLPINTEGNDITPFFHASSQTLFYSSDGRKGMGGYDVFLSEKTTNKTWKESENLGYPLNSSYDEIYYTLHSRAKLAHFSSNRTGSIFNNAQSGGRLSYDIYKAEINVEFAAKIYNSLDSADLKGVRLELINLIGKELDAALADVSSNSFILPLDLENSYAIAANLAGYIGDTVMVNTRGQNRSITYERNLYLKPELGLIVRVFNSIDNKPINAATIMISDKDGSQNWVMESPKNGNEVRFSLLRGKEYLIKSHLQGFQMGSVSTANSMVDESGKMVINIYLKPIKPVP